ncbi:unnamed protein product, partial [Eruca vesicaria subsp. sativa]|nr:unnamed protein product [Eruca vesicaria subsp. sativa]
MCLEWGYKSLRKLRNLEVLDFSLNVFDNSLLPFLNAATSLTTIFFRRNSMDGPFPIKELSTLVKLKALDLSGNHFSCSLGIKGMSSQISLLTFNTGSEFTLIMKMKVLHLTIAGICQLKTIQELDLSQNNLV